MSIVQIKGHFNKLLLKESKRDVLNINAIPDLECNL